MQIIREKALLEPSEQILAGLPRLVNVGEINFWRILDRTRQAEAELQAKLTATQPLSVARNRVNGQRVRAFEDRRLAYAITTQLLRLPCEIELYPPPISNELDDQQRAA